MYVKYGTDSGDNIRAMVYAGILSRNGEGLREMDAETVRCQETDIAMS